jgi:hypothetical protein
LPRKTRRPLKKKEKTHGRTFQAERWPVTEGYRWRVPYREELFSNISSGVQTLFFSPKEITRENHKTQISTECVGLEWGGLTVKANSLSLPSLRL